jgi:hypothetical protein
MRREGRLSATSWGWTLWALSYFPTSKRIQFRGGKGGRALTSWPSKHGHLELSLLADDIHHVLPPSEPTFKDALAVLLDEELLGRGGLGVVDDTTVDASAEVLDEARVELVRDGVVRVDECRGVDEERGRVERLGVKGALGAVRRRRVVDSGEGRGGLGSVRVDSGHDWRGIG